MAVKTLKVGSNYEDKLSFLSEAEMMKRFEHRVGAFILCMPYGIVLYLHLSMGGLLLYLSLIAILTTTPCDGQKTHPINHRS